MSVTWKLKQGVTWHDGKPFTADDVVFNWEYAKDPATAAYTIEGLADRITCPALICEGEDDIRGGDAKPLYDAVVAPKEYLHFTNAEGAGEHDEAGAASLFAQRVFDWLDETLAEVA